jgi:hypothetical protein
MPAYYTQTQFQRAAFERSQDQELRNQTRIDPGATKEQRLGWLTVICLILNRTIGR